jgi:hypothetical protein
MDDVELLNLNSENLAPSDEHLVAQGEIFVSGRQIGSWEVRTGNRWTAILINKGLEFNSQSRDELKKQITEALEADPS